MQGAVQGLATSTQLAGRIFGTLLAGVVLERFGYFGVYALMTALVLLIVFQAFRFVVAEAGPAVKKQSTGES